MVLEKLTICKKRGEFKVTINRFYYWNISSIFLNLILFIILYSRFLLVIYFTHISIYMSIPISQFIPPPSHLPPPTPPLTPFCVRKFVLYIYVSISALQTGSSVSFFYIPHIYVNIRYLFF